MAMDSVHQFTRGGKVRLLELYIVSLGSTSRGSVALDDSAYYIQSQDSVPERGKEKRISTIATTHIHDVARLREFNGHRCREGGRHANALTTFVRPRPVASPLTMFDIKYCI